MSRWLCTVACGWLLGSGCTADPLPPMGKGEHSGRDDSAADVDADAALRLSKVQWAMRADTSLLQAVEGGVRLERADGAALEIHEAWVVVYVLVLEPCDESTTDGLRGQPVPPPHGVPDHPSAMTRSRAVPLHTNERVTGDALTFPEDAFCQVGVALFRGEGTTENAPSEDAVNGITLRVDGRLRRSASAEWEELALRTALAAEADLPLSPPERAPAPGRDPRITLTFHPETLLTDVDFSEGDDRTALRMLENLVRLASVTLDLDGP